MCDEINPHDSPSDERNEDGAGAIQSSSTLPVPPRSEWESTDLPIVPLPLRIPPDLPHVPGYEILGELGSGGMGVVYQARSLQLNRLVALKMVRSGTHAVAEELRRFWIEAEAVARLQHPGIVQIYEIGESGGLPYFALEFINGGSLAHRLRGMAMSGDEAARLIETLARAIHYAHERNIIHRDLKPANILLQSASASGEWREKKVEQTVPSLLTTHHSPLTLPLVPKIADFGLAKRIDLDDGQTRTGAILGTPSYMAPEQVGNAKTVGPAADVYALGSILYECLTGRPPFKAATVTDTLLQVLGDDPLPPRRLQPKVARDLETICLKCLQKSPERRYASAEALADDLRRFLDGRPIEARPAGTVERAWKWAHRRPAAAALVAVCVTATTSLLVLGLVFNAQLARKLSEISGLQENVRREQASAVQANEEARQKNEQAEEALYLARFSQAREALTRNDPLRAIESLDRCPPGRRRWEWHLLKRMIHADRLTFSAANFDVLSLAVSADGRLLATGGGRYSEGFLKIWGLFIDFKPLNLAIHHGPVTAASFSPDGQFLASVSTLVDWAKVIHDQRADLFNHPNGEIILWDVASGKRICSHEGYGTVAFSPDGKWLAWPGLDHAIRLIDTRSGEVSQLPPHDGRVTGLAFSTDGWLATASVHVQRDASRNLQLRTQIRLQTPGPQKELWSLPGDRNEITHLAFDPQGKRLAVSGTNGVALLDTSNGREVTRLIGSVGGSNATAFPPDGKIIATAQKDHTVRIWDATTGEELFALRGHTSRLQSVAFDPSRRGSNWRLISGDTDGVVKVWEAASCQGFRPIRGHTGMIAHVAFSPDGRLLASPGAEGAVLIQDAVTGSLLRKIPCYAEQVAFSPDGKWLATAEADVLQTVRGGKVRLWPVAAQGEPRTLLSEPLPVLGVAFSPDGQRLAVCTGNPATRKEVTGKVIVCDVAGRSRRSFVPDVGLIAGLTFSPDGQSLAVAGWVGRLQLVSADTGEMLRKFEGNLGRMYRAAFSADGRKLAGGDDRGVISVWDVSTGALQLSLRGGEGVVFALAFRGAHGDRLASANISTTSARGAVKLWDTRSGEELLTLPGKLGVAFSQDGNQLAAIRSGTILDVPELCIWDGATTHEAFTVRIPDVVTNDVAMHRDGNQFASAHADGIVRLWEAKTGRAIRTLKAHAQSANGVAYSPLGDRLATCGGDGIVRLWPRGGAEASRDLKGHTGWVVGVAFSPDGRLLASTGKDQTVRLWDGESGEPRGVLSGHERPTFRLAFHPEGRLLASADRDGIVLLWDVQSRKRVYRLEAHRGPAVGVAFSPDGMSLATAGADKIIRIWDVESGRNQREIRGHDQGAICVTYSPDGKRLASTGNDQSVRVWDARTGKQVFLLRGHVDAPFTAVFGPDGARLFSVGDHCIKAWEVSEGKEEKGRR